MIWFPPRVQRPILHDPFVKKLVEEAVADALLYEGDPDEEVLPYGIEVYLSGGFLDKLKKEKQNVDKRRYHRGRNKDGHAPEQ